MISIAMATYNGAKFLREQLDSILAQSIGDFELVISDDGSTDATWSILIEYAELDERIRLFQNKKNIGFKKNFEKVIGYTRGDYVALCDQDDIWEPDHLKLLLNHLGDKMIACGDSLLIDSNDKSLYMTLSTQEALDYIPVNDMERAYTIFYFRSPFQGAGMLIKREFFDVALPIPDDIAFHDVWFSELSCFYGGMNYFKIPISRYRQHNNNVTGGRIKRRPKFGAWLRKILRGFYLQDRAYTAIQIIDRVKDLSDEQMHFLEEVVRHVKRKKTIWGRLLNSIFELRHFKLIYSCNGKYWE